jgi:hypothetical protein
VTSARTLHDAHVPTVTIAKQLGVPYPTVAHWLNSSRRADG